MKKEVRSEFGFLGILLAFFVTAMFPFLFYMSVTSPAAGTLIPILYLLVVIYFWLTEFRTRAHRVAIEANGISAWQYFGFGKPNFLPYSDFQGLHYFATTGKNGTERIHLPNEERKKEDLHFKILPQKLF